MNQHHDSRGNWPRFLLFPCMAVFGYGLLVSLVEQQSWWLTAGWVAILSFAWFCLAGSFHEAAHNTLFKTPILNEIFGQLVGFFILIPFSAFRATHRTHHAYLNTPQDYELWPYSNPNYSLTFRRMFALTDLVLGIITAPIIYSRVNFSKTVKLTAREAKFIPREVAVMFIGWSVIITGIAVLISRGYYQPKPEHLIFLLPLFFSPMINTLRKFSEHLGMASIDPVAGTRTVAGKNWLTNLTSYFLFDISVHGPHHRYPKVPGGELKNKLAEMREADPEREIPVFPTYWHALRDMLPWIWKNPGVGMSAWPEITEHARQKSTPKVS